MAVGTIYCLKMKQFIFGQDVLNQFFYRQTETPTSGPDESGGLFEAFNDDILVYWVDMVGDHISILEVEVFNIQFPADNHTAVPSNSVGTRTFTSALKSPSWVAAGFKSNRAGAGTRSSYKRFAGLGETDCDSNFLSSAFLALAPVTNLTVALGDAVESAGGAKFVPVQIKATWAITLPPSENFEITTWVAPVLTSQVSRKG